MRAQRCPCVCSLGLLWQSTAEWLKPETFLISWFWRPEVETKPWAGLRPPCSLPGRLLQACPCLLVASCVLSSLGTLPVSAYVQISPVHKETNSD